MELTWHGRYCVRLRGKDATVVADPFVTDVGPTGRGLTADIVTFSHAEEPPGELAKKVRPVPTRSNGRLVLAISLEKAFLLDSPGEYEIRDVLVTGVRTYRGPRVGDEERRNVSFVFELDGLHTCHLGDIGHLLSEDELGEIGSVEIVCVPIGGQLSPSLAAELVAQLDPRLVVPLPVCAVPEACSDALGRFLHEMGVKDALPQARLSVTPGSLPEETGLVLLESRART